MTLRDVTNSSAQNIYIYSYWSRFLLYGPYIRAVCTGVKNAPVYNGRSLHTTRIYGPYSRKALRTMFFLCGPYIYGPYIRVTGTHYPCIRPVHTYVRAVCTGVKNAPVYTGRKHGPYVRVLGTHYLHRIAVLYGPYIRAVYTSDRYALAVNVGRTYGYTGVKNAPVCTGRTYGPYIRAVFTVVRIGL